MKANFLSLPLVTAMLFLGTSYGVEIAIQAPAVSASLLASPTQPALSEQDKEILKRFDKNADGVLDEEELAAAHESMYRNQIQAEVIARRIYDQMLAKFDVRHEGKLDLAQQEQALEYLKTEHPEAYKKALARFARQGSGLFSTGEKSAFFQYLSNLPSTLAKKEIKEIGTAEYSKTEKNKDTVNNLVTPKPAQKLYMALLKNFDAEHKGKLTPKQKQQAVEFIQNNRPQVFETLIKKYDFNGNGKLDEEEITKFFGDLEKTISTKEENEMGM